MLPISFDTQGWRLNLSPASLRSGRLLLTLADGRELDLISEADEPAVAQVGETATVTRMCAFAGLLLAQMTWVCHADAVTLRVRLKAQQPLTLATLTYLDAPLSQVLLEGELPTRRLVTQPGDMGFRSAPGAYPLDKGPETGSMALALGNSAGALLLGQVGEPRYLLKFSTANGRLCAWSDLEGKQLAPGDDFDSEQLYVTAAATVHTALERYGDRFAPLGRYTAADASGWNSWDYYLRSINQEMVDENVDVIDARPWLRQAARAIVIDDGWQNSRGDWRSGSHFDLPAFVARCRQAGRLPGIWLAPFCVDTNSPLVRQRPDLLCLDANGIPQIGLMWYILDPTQAEAEGMIRRWFHDLYALGFRYFKVDFIFVLMLAERMAHADEPRLAMVRRLLRAIREEIGDSYFLGCSAPPEAAVGICDGNRIGADIRPDWGAIQHGARTVGAKYWMHNRLWISDADFVVVRSPATSDDPYREHPMTLSRRAMAAGMGMPGMGGPMTPPALGAAKPATAGAPPQPSRPPEAPSGDAVMAFMGRKPQPLTQLGETRCWATISVLTGGPLTLSDRLSQLNAAGWQQIETMFSLFTGEAARPLDLLASEIPTIWVRAGSAPLLALFNWGDAPAEVQVTTAILPTALRGALVDAWSGQEYQANTDTLAVPVAPRDVVLLRPA